MKALIVDLIPDPDGTCEVTRKKNVECYLVRMEGNEEATMTPLELLKMLRFRKSQQKKAAAAVKPNDDK